MSEQIKDATIVTRMLNWRGEHTGYQVVNAWVPLDQGNSDARMLAEKIASGHCAVLDPEIMSASPTYDRNNNLTGYDTNVGFVPFNEENALYKILAQKINSGECKFTEPDRSDIPVKISHLKYYVTFDRPWPHLKGEFLRSWRYRPNDKSAWHNLNIKLLNLPVKTDDLYPHIFQAAQATAPSSTLHQLLPIRKALLEIEVPVESLRRLFEGERAVGFGWRDVFLEDSVAQNMVRSGRAHQEGPDIQWLLANASSYLSRAIVDVANRVVGSFCREYGGQSVGFLSEAAIQRKMFVFARREDGTVVIHHVQFQPDQDHQLEGQWLHGTPTPDTDEPHRLRQYNSEDALFRVRRLIESGFPLEALSVANAFLEMVALPVALALVHGNKNAEEEVEESGYMRRIDILNAGALAEPSGYVREALEKYVATAREIYPHRNDYMHNLKSRDHDYWRTVDLVRQANRLLDPLLDHFHGMIWLGHLGSIITRTSHLTDAAIAAAQHAAQPRTELSSVKSLLQNLRTYWRK